MSQKEGYINFEEYSQVGEPQKAERAYAWSTNTTQPSLEMLFKISELLQVPIQELVRKQNF